MKNLVVFAMIALLSSAAPAWGPSLDNVRSSAAVNLSGCDGPKQEQTSNGVQVRLEVCGSDHDGYDIDAANPNGEKKFDCSYSFTLSGKKKSDGSSNSVSRDKTITVSSTAKGWFNAFGESGLDTKDLKISSFSVSCS